MGRPLKIQKLSTGSSISGGSVSVDLAYPPFSALTNPVVNSADTLDSAQFLGVVGGADPTDTPSATYPRVDVIVNIADPAGSGLGVHTGYIIRQKGAHKYLVGDADAAIDPNTFTVGQAYQIVSVGDTPWSTIGGGNNAAVGTIFTATAAADAGTTGTAYPVGVCVLQDDVTPTAGGMAITYTESTGDSTATTISKLTNKFLLNWAGGSDYAATSVVNDERYVANFFTDEGTVIKSGTAQVTVPLAIVDNVTS
jgi:hypothetical protein